MDVLQYWTPQIDWGQFIQGPVSDRMWEAFREVVQLCHAQQHWEAAAYKMKLTPLPVNPFGEETKHQKRKRGQERKQDIERAEGHMYRAQHLADEKIAQMSHMLTKGDQGTPDWKLYFALRHAVAPRPNYVGARFDVAAFKSFDADAELTSDVEDIIDRWKANRA
jgi:hypothetical protein